MCKKSMVSLVEKLLEHPLRISSRSDTRWLLHPMFLRHQNGTARVCQFESVKRASGEMLLGQRVDVPVGAVALPPNHGICRKSRTTRIVSLWFVCGTRVPDSPGGEQALHASPDQLPLLTVQLGFT